MSRTAGVLCPLVSLRSRASHGAGEIPDLERVAPWLAEAKLRLLMVLPLLEPGGAHESPYGPLSAFAVDPLLIGLDRVEEHRGFDDAERAVIEAAQASPRIEYGTVRPLKMRALRRAFAR